MIISKHQKVKNKLVDLQVALETDSRSAAARAEAKLAREESLETGKCRYCGEELLEVSPRFTEACVKCGKKISNLLTIKSKLMHGVYTVKGLENLLEAYTTMLVIPYPLRSDSAMRATQELLDAHNEHEQLEKELRFKKRWEEYVAKVRRRNAQTLRDAGMSVDDERYEAKLEEMVQADLERT